jgi:serine/threonine-protein kinase
MDTMDRMPPGPPSGQLLDGRYQVTSSIAHGGMATVYLGVDTRLDRTVAIKIMHAELAADEAFVARFIREARSIARLSHPNVVSVYDQGSDGQHLYLAMEYVRGRTLRQLLTERGRLSPREALDIIESVLAGLAAAHRAGIVHRDVKPENVLLAEDGRVKVADFGLARSTSGTSHTKTGVLMGTVAYLAPEQVTASASDTRCDVYAAGVMLFEMLTGRQPHVGESALAVAYKHVNETIPPPSDVLPGLPQALDVLVAMATSRDPRLRPADAGQFLEAVGRVRHGQPVSWPPPLPAAGPPPPAAGPMPQPGGPMPQPAGPPLVPGFAPAGPPHAPGLQAQLAGPPVPAPRAGGAQTPEGVVAIAGQWGAPDPFGPPAVPGERTAAHMAPAQHTLIVDRPGNAPPREPRLQRWLFSRRLIYLLAAVVVLALVGGGTWWQLSGRYTRVPGVAGLSLTAAGNELRTQGFKVRTGQSRLDNAVAKGSVINTAPAVAARVRKGSMIELIPSAGPRMITVPQVSGQPLANAQAALRQAGLAPGKVTSQVSATIAAGVVISTSPGSGASWPQPKPVGITVSAGPPLPNFVGQQQSAAQAWGQANGVSVNVQNDKASSQPQGTITKQSPGENTPVTKGEVITVYVSPGPPEVAIPGNLDGKGLLQAYKVLHQLGFQVTTQRVGPFGKTVFNYSPTGQAPKGSTITLYYGLPNL